MNRIDPEAQKTPESIRDALSDDDKFLTVTYSATAVTIIVLLINLLRIGGGKFILGLDSFAALATAILAATFSLRIRDHLKEPRADLLWMALTIGFGLWACVEAIRLFTLVLLQQPQAPFINWLWVFGYFPIFYGIFLRHQFIETEPTRQQRRLVWGSAGAGIIFILLTIVLPAFLGTAPRYVSGSVFAVLYALADLGLGLLLLRIILSYQGVYGAPWSFIAFAFWIKFLGDVVLQFPNNFGTSQSGWFHFLLGIANFAHFNWYAVVVLGLFVYETVITFQQKPVASTRVKEEIVPNASALIFTDDQDKVIKTSINFRYLLRLPDNIATEGTQLQEVLGISEPIYQDFKAQLRAQGNAKKFVVEPSYFRAGHKAWITAAAALDAQKKYSGVNMVVQVVAEGVGGAGLTNEERALVENIFYLTGTEGEESEKLLINYFNRSYRMLSSLVTEYEGSRRAAGLSELVNQVANKQKMSVRVLEQEINVTGDIKLDELGKSISVLLAAARGYVINLAGLQVVQREIDLLHRQIDRSTRALVERYKLAK